MRFVIRGWKGEERLWKVTWLGYLGGALIVAIAAIGLYAILGDASAWIVGPAIIVLNVWALVAMWRCAPNVNWRIWFYLARIVVAATAIMWALELVGYID